MEQLFNAGNSDINDFLSSKVRNVILSDYLPNQLVKDLKVLRKKEYKEEYYVIFQIFAKDFVKYFEQCGPNKVNLERLSQQNMVTEGNSVSIGSTAIQTMDQEMEEENQQMPEEEIEQMPEEENQQETILYPQLGELRVVSDQEMDEILRGRYFEDHQNSDILGFPPRDVQMNNNEEEKEEEIKPVERVSPNPSPSDYLQMEFLNKCLVFEETNFPSNENFQIKLN